MVVRTFGVRRRSLPDVHERARLLDTAGPDSARAVQFDAAADEAHAVREQRGCERVAAKPAVSVRPLNVKETGCERSMKTPAGAGKA